VENRVAAKGGLLPEDKESQVERMQTKFEGLNLGTAGGIKSRIQDYKPEIIHDVSVIKPKDRQLFTRITSGPALDIYVIGSDYETAQDSFTALGGETQITLLKPPVASVESVFINNVQVSTFSFVADDSLELKSSTRSVDRVIFSSPLILNDVVLVNYTYNKLLSDIEEDVFSSDESTLFDTDMLMRSAIDVKIAGQMQLQVLPSFDPNRVQANVVTELESILQPEEFISSHEPEAIRQILKSTVLGIQSLTVTEFRRQYDSLSTVEVVSFKDNERSVFDESIFDVGLVS
jgi:hypothetical protein